MPEKVIVVTEERLREAYRNAKPPTDDDVTITNDGRRLDTKEKVIEYLNLKEWYAEHPPAAPVARHSTSTSWLGRTPAI